MNGKIVDSEFETKFTTEDYNIVKATVKVMKNLKNELTPAQKKLLAYCNDESGEWIGTIEFDGMTEEESDAACEVALEELDVRLTYC
jgi:hypothetical protein